MPPRFMQRMQRQSEVLRDVFGEPSCDPPPYPFQPTRSPSTSTTSSFHSRQNRRSRNSTSMSIQYNADDGSSMNSYNFPPPPGYQRAAEPTSPGFDITALPLDSLVHVTGANSFQGIHIVDQLLENGYRVRGAVRDAETAVWTAKVFKDRHGAGRYTTAVIPDMAERDAYDLAIRSCSGVIHCASVTKPELNPHEVITPSIAGALNALEAAAKEPAVQRFVYCSCACAAVSHDRGVPNVVNSEGWNLLDFEDAWAPPPYGPERVLAVQASAKMQTEQAVWRWYGGRRPSFVLNTVLPDTLWGPAISPQQQDLPPSVLMLKDLVEERMVFIAPGHFVDVVDSARIHLAALLFPDVKNERVFAVNAPYNASTLRYFLQALYPDKPLQGERELQDLSEDLTVFREAGRAEALLRRMGRLGWTNIQDSIARSCEGF